jgi:Leucine-rich repeat (LRR) protein
MRLDEIQLSGTKQALEKFPALLSDFVFLRRLSLTHHTFSDIPEDLPPLPHLSFLDLSHNHLTSFPKALASFDALSILDPQQSAKTTGKTSTFPWSSCTGSRPCCCPEMA